MRKHLRTTARTLDSFTRLVGEAISWLTLGMVLLTFVVVLLRYVFSVGWVWMQESVLYFHSAVFLLGSAYTLLNKGHVRVDILYQTLSSRKKAIIDAFGVLFLLFPMLWLIYTEAMPYVVASWEVRESSSDAGGLTGVYLLKTLILSFVGLLAVQGISELAKSILTLTEPGSKPPSETGSKEEVRS